MLPPQPEVVPQGAADPSASSQIAQLVQSAAYAAECPIAVFYLGAENGFELSYSFGITSPVVAAAAHRILVAATQPYHHGLLVINDIKFEPGLAPQDIHLFGEQAPAIRFVAATHVVDGPGMDHAGVVHGVLVVADLAPHAGLSVAKTYVLRAHAAQLSTLLELHDLRAAARLAPPREVHRSPEAHRSPGSHQSQGVRQTDTERLRMLEAVVVNASDAVLITQAEPIDLPGPRIVYCNAAFTRTTGYAEAEIIGLTPRLLQSSRTDRKTLAKLRRALSRWEPVEVELLNARKDGSEFWVELSIVPVADESGWFTHWVSVQRDISERKTAEDAATRTRAMEAARLLETNALERRLFEQQLLYTSFHDDLTKLRNRAFFMDRLAIALGRMAKNPGFRIGVLVVNLDRFKLVNDSLGHRAGDLLLMETGQRLRSCTRPQDTLARVGGDEFALLVEGFDETGFAGMLAAQIIETMSHPLWIGGQEIFSTCSIGLVQATPHHRLPEELLRDANIAMHQAKQHDTGSYALFAGAMHDSAVEALRLWTDLQHALARGEFLLNYQPICRADTTEITGWEALIRWQHPSHGLVPPNVFIGVAEENGLIRQIGRWVLREACMQMGKWRDRFPGLKLLLSVNTSAEELKDDRFIADVQETLATTGLDPHSLQIELTESVFSQDAEFIDRIFGRIRKLGIRIALDDFGTGYSSLSYLDRYQMDAIKIDQSFVANMLTRPRTQAIVKTIVELGQALELDIVAEGVETGPQLQTLLATGCGSVQGYFLGRPMSAEAATGMLARQFASKISVART